MSVPYPDPIVWHVVSGLLPDVAGRVGDELTDELPAVRVTKVGDHEAPSTWEATPLFQIEVWAADTYTAGKLAWDLVNVWPSAKPDLVSLLIGDDETPYALVHGRWTEVNPNSSPDDETDLARFIVTVGIRLSGVS